MMSLRRQKECYIMVDQATSSFARSSQMIAGS